VTLPPHSLIKKCTTWVPPFPGHFCAQVSLIDPAQPQRYPVVRSQRNMDVGEVFERGQWTKPYVFRVGNPFTDVTNIECLPLSISRLGCSTRTARIDGSRARRHKARHADVARSRTGFAAAR